MCYTLTLVIRYDLLTDPAYKLPQTLPDGNWIGGVITLEEARNGRWVPYGSEEDEDGDGSAGSAAVGTCVAAAVAFIAAAF